MIRDIHLPLLLRGLDLRLRPLATLSLWRAAARQRRALARLDATALADIGLTRHEALTEAERPFWDAPDNWRL